MIADNWIRSRDEPPLYLDGQLEVYRGYFGPTDLPVLVKSSRPGNAIGELARSMELQYRAALAAGPGATPQPVYFGPYRDRIILAFEDIGGKTINHLLGVGPWHLQAAVDLGIGILRAILVFHRAGWLHRAVRPNHVIQDEVGRILLIGLGSTRYIEDAGPDYYKLPGSCEDRMYLAPEQTGRLSMESSWRTDIYAAGAVLYTLLAGRPPFDSQDPVDILYDAIAGVPPAPGSFRHEPSRFLDAVVAKAMAKDPEHRYQTVTGFIHDLEMFRSSADYNGTPAEHDSPEDFFSSIPSRYQTRSRLSPGEMYAIMNEVFPGDHDKTGTLSGLAPAVTGGRPEALKSYFSGLATEGHIWFEAPRCRWQVIEHAFDGAGIPIEMESSLPAMLKSFGEGTQRFLECAACAGEVFDPDAVAAILRSWESREELTKSALAAGLIVPSGGNDRNYRFSHESIPRLLYESLESIRKSAWHNAFAKRYEAAGRPDLALPHLLADPLKHQAGEDAIQRALIFVQAGASRVHSDPAHSLELLDKARMAMGSASWQEVPELATEIALLSMSCASRLGDVRSFDKHRREAMRMAPAAELPRIDEVAVQGLSALGKSTEALSCAVEALRRLGLKLPEKPGRTRALLVFASTMLVLRGTGAGLAELPDMTKPEAGMSLAIIAAAGPSAYIAKPDLIPFLAAAGLRLCRRYGFHPQSAVLCAAMGMIAISRFGWYRLGYRFGKLAERLSARPSSIDTYAQSRFVVMGFINHWFKSNDECLEAYLDAGRAGRSTGDHDYGSHAYSLYFQQAVIGGKELAAAYTFLPETQEALTSMSQELPCRVFQATAALMDSLKHVDDPSGTAIFDGRSLAEWQTSFAGQGQYLPACDMALYRAITGYMFSNFREARLAIDESKAYASSLEGTFSGISLQILDCILAGREALTEIGDTAERPTPYRFLYRLLNPQRSMARLRLRRLRARLVPLARMNSMVYEPRLLMVKALLQFHRGRTMKAFDTFERAVALSRTTGSHLDEVVVSAEYAACLTSAGRQALAYFYQRAVYTALVRWGATGVAEAMALKYPSIKTWVSVSPHSSQGSGLLTLDAEALLKASAVIAAERDGTALLKSLLDVTMTTSGARFGVVWIPRGDGWEIAASASYGAGSQGAVIIDEGQADVPAEKLRNCCEVQRTLVGGFGNGIGSVAYIPLLSRGTARGVLQLGNEIMAGAFPPDRMKIVEAIAAQASISIENAELYANLERKVVERTRDLEDALKNVRQLRGLIPICSSCKKVRDDTGYWSQVEEYISARTEADFTHGLCPDCLAHYYDEMEIHHEDRRKETP